LGKIFSWIAWTSLLLWRGVYHIPLSNCRTLILLIVLGALLVSGLAIPDVPVERADWEKVAKGPTIQQFELLNGLRILMVQTATTSDITAHLLIKSGSAQDPYSKRGLANLTAQRLLVRNCDQEINLESLGIKLEFDVQPDATILRGSTRPHRVGFFLELLAAMLSPSGVTPETLPSTVQLRRNTLEISKADIFQFASLFFRRAIFENHPYGRSLGQVGFSSEISQEDLELFRKEYYVPNNSALVLVGAISSDDLLDMVREKLGPWTKKHLARITYPEPQVLERLSIQLVQKTNTSSAAGILFGHTVPGRQSTDFYTLKALNLILGGLGSGSRLSSSFLSHRIKYSLLDSNIRFYRLGGILEVLARIPGPVAPAALTAIIDAIEGVKQSPISEAELEKAKTQLIAWHLERLGSPRLLADQLIQMELFSLSKNFLDHFPERISELTVDDLQRAAKTHLSTTRAVAVITGVNEEVSTQLSNLGLSEVVIPPVLPNTP